MFGFIQAAKVLILDDDPVMRRLVRACLTKHSRYKVLEAAFGAEEAIKRIAKLYGIEKEVHGHPPDERVKIR